LLGKTLDSVLPQMTDEVEIVIIDGASTDETEDVVRGFLEKHPSLHYYRKNTNSGVDRDYNASIEAARGEYCWFISDDDLIKPGALRRILELAEKGYSAIVVNAEDWNADFTVPLGKNRLPFAVDRVYQPQEFDQLFIDTVHHLSFIPALVIRRDIWVSREREKYFGSWFTHVGVVFQSPLPSDTFLVAAPLVAIRNENISWVGRMFEIWMIRWPDLIWSFPHFSDSLKEMICPKNPSMDWRALLAYRAKGAYTFKEYKQHILPRTTDIKFRLLAALVSVIPPSFINTLSFIYRNNLAKR